VRLKLDENLGRSVAEMFRSAGHDATTFREERRQGAPDEAVFEVSLREPRTLVTLDRDFGQILRFPPAEGPGIIVVDPVWIVEPGRPRIHLADDDG
jgi:predicted nuclease of predicted toxin-antitoxin system